MFVDHYKNRVLLLMSKMALQYPKGICEFVEYPRELSIGFTITFENNTWVEWKITITKLKVIRKQCVLNISDGAVLWLKNGELHREGGPAVEWPGGNKEWWVNGKVHRLDGPAIEYHDGHKSWYIEDKYIHCNSQEEFERFLKLKAFW